MVTVIDRLTNPPRPRHPEKAQRPAQEALRKSPKEDVNWVRSHFPKQRLP